MCYRQDIVSIWAFGRFLEFSESISSKFLCYCSMSFLSLENPKSSSKSLKFPKDNDYGNEKIW